MKEKNIQEIAIRMGLITVEDMCQYTIAQLVVKIANKVNELVNEVWRFETDVQEILKTQNENIQYLLGEGLHLEVENIFDGWVQDGTFDTLLNQSALKKVNDRIDETNAQLSQVDKKKLDNAEYSSSFKHSLNTQFYFQIVGGDEIDENADCRMLQGGIVANGKIIYALINGDDDKTLLIERDLESCEVTRTKESTMLGHVNDIAFDGTHLYIPKGDTLIKINNENWNDVEIVNAPFSQIQGVDYFNNKFYFKINDNATIQVTDVHFNLEKSITLSMPIDLAQYNQGICVNDDGIIDVRGIPASIYRYDFDGNYLGCCSFPKTANIYDTGELEFVSKFDGVYYYGGLNIAGGTSNFNIATFGKFTLDKPIFTNNPFENSSTTGYISLYVDSLNASVRGNGTKSNPFPHIYQAISLLDNKLIRRLRIVNGSFNNIQIQGKNFSLIGNGNTINGLKLFQCKADISNLIINDGELTEYALYSDQSEVFIGSSSKINGITPIGANNSKVFVSGSVKLNNTGEYRIHLKASETNHSKYIKAEEASTVICSKVVDNTVKLDNSSNFGGRQVIYNGSLSQGSASYSATIPFHMMHCRVEFLSKTYDIMIPIEPNQVQNRHFSVALAGYLNNDYYTGVYSLRIDTNNSTVNVEENHAYNHTTNNGYTVNNKPSNLNMPVLTQISAF